MTYQTNNIKNRNVSEVFNAYPKAIREKLLQLRQLILDSAVKNHKELKLEETLKWGEPSYLIKGGSTIRMNHIKSNPDKYALYFHCKTKLVDTFRELYSDTLIFDGNRAIIFNINDELSVKEVKRCIALSLNYHNIKHLPLLGV